MNKSLLENYIRENLEKKFEWGKQDCTTFIAKWAEINTGKDYLKEVKNWKSLRTALRTIKEVGGLKKHLNSIFTQIPARLAVDGDIGIFEVKWETGEACGIFYGNFLYCVGEYGLIRKERTEAIAAWKIK